MVHAIIFWAEAGHGIGMGHLMECVALAETMRRRGLAVRFIVPPYPAAAEILDRFGLPWTPAPIIASELPAPLNAGQPGLVIIDHRAVSLDHLRALHTSGWRLAVIDQLGGRAIIGDLLINGSLPEAWRRYEFPDGAPDCLFGPAYAILRSEFAARSDDIADRGGIETTDAPTVLVSMGGVDRTGATLRVATALLPLGLGVRKEIVVGAGFIHRAALDSLPLDDSFVVAQAVTDMPTRMARARLAISAGGNTLVELACLGVPALVLWEDPHEATHGEAFAAAGAARVVGNGLGAPVDAIAAAVGTLLTDTPRLAAMARAGRALVDGQGCKRVCDALQALSPA